MTEEQQEDVKPKINLVVDFEGQSKCLLSRARSAARRVASRGALGALSSTNADIYA